MIVMYGKTYEYTCSAEGVITNKHGKILKTSRDNSVSLTATDKSKKYFTVSHIVVHEYMGVNVEKIESVKYIDGNTSNNNIYNLQVKEKKDRKIHKCSEALRCCSYCGLKAHTKEALPLFVDDRKGKYGKANFCIECKAEWSKERYSRDKTRILKVNKDYRHSDRGKQVKKKWMESEIGKESMRRYETSDKGKAKTKRAVEKYNKTEKGAKARKVASDNYYNNPKHRGKLRANWAKRRASKLQRTPKWLTEDDLWVIEQFYITAAERTEQYGIQFHVDHIIPLNGKTVSGLHVPENLQILPWYENIEKSNKYEMELK